VNGAAAPPLPPDLDALLRCMRLPCLRVLLAEEVAGRDAVTRRMRRKTAGFPAGKTFSSWRPGESSSPPRPGMP
jgi:hypothetical protein